MFWLAFPAGDLECAGLAQLKQIFSDVESKPLSLMRCLQVVPVALKESMDGKLAFHNAVLSVINQTAAENCSAGPVKRNLGIENGGQCHNNGRKGYWGVCFTVSTGKISIRLNREGHLLATGPSL